MGQPCHLWPGPKHPSPEGQPRGLQPGPKHPSPPRSSPAASGQAPNTRPRQGQPHCLWPGPTPVRPLKGRLRPRAACKEWLVMFPVTPSSHTPSSPLYGQGNRGPRPHARPQPLLGSVCPVTFRATVGPSLPGTTRRGHPEPQGKPWKPPQEHGVRSLGQEGLRLSEARAWPSGQHEALSRPL